MNVYRTIVTELPATPLGLLPARWHIEHHCTTCHRIIPTDQLINHTRDDHHHTEEATPTTVPDQPTRWGKSTSNTGEFQRAAAHAILPSAERHVLRVQQVVSARSAGSGTRASSRQARPSRPSVVWHFATR
jgi:hypothetical protein